MKSFVLAAWSSGGGPWRSVASELAVALSNRPGSPSSNAWSARPRRNTPRHNVGLKLLRALYCMPSRVSVCAHLTGHGSIGSGGAALTLETGAELQIGPIALMPLFTVGGIAMPALQSLLSKQVDEEKQGELLEDDEALPVP